MEMDLFYKFRILSMIILIIKINIVLNINFSQLWSNLIMNYKYL